MSDAEIVPFGKYRDRPVTDLLADRGYVEWLLAQPWFPERQPTIYNVIIGSAGEPQDTPEHNAMQARYLADELCRRLARGYLSDRDMMLKKVRQRREKRATPTQLANLITGDETYRLELTEPQFELGGWDVAYEATATLTGPSARVPIPESPRDCPRCRPTEHNQNCIEETRRYYSYDQPLWRTNDGDADPWDCYRCRPAHHQGECPAAASDASYSGYDHWRDILAGHWERVYLLIELKPSIADDYPTILRDVVKRRELQAARRDWLDHYRPVVITDRLHPSTVTADQVKAMFASRKVNLLLTDEIG